MAYQHQRPQTKLWAGAAVFLALLAMCCAAPRTACPRKVGFDAVPDKIAFNSPKGYYGASQPAEAGTMCASEAACVSFDNLGIRHFVEVGRMEDSPGACTYIKQACPKVEGFETLVNKRWAVAAAANASGSGGGGTGAGAAPISANKGSAAAAAAYCNATAACLAWSDKGDTLTLPQQQQSASAGAGAAAAVGGMAAAAAAGVSFPNAAEAVCAYLKDPCPPKYGYANRKDTRFVAPTGVAGVRLGSIGSVEVAQEFCRISPKCTGWNTAGQVMIGGIKSYEPAPGVCSYVKQPCPAVPGFIAHDGVTLPPTSAPDASRNATSFADVVLKCTMDLRCTAFDTLRRTWSVGSAAEPSVPFPGMCTFVKVSGLLR